MGDDKQTRPDTAIDEAISGLSTRLGEEIAALSTRPELQEGIMQAALADVVWDLYMAFPHARDTLHNQLGELGMAVQSAMRTDQAQQLRPT